MSLSLKLGSNSLYLGGKILLPKVTSGVTEALVRNNQANIYLLKAVVKKLKESVKYVINFIIKKPEQHK